MKREHFTTFRTRPLAAAIALALAAPVMAEPLFQVPLYGNADMTRALSEEQKQALLKQIPAGRLGAPEEIAEAVAFLASPAAAYITGQTLSVNGGMLMP